jgi:hypothetical protein
LVDLNDKMTIDNKKNVDLTNNQLGHVEIYMFNMTQWSNQQMLQLDVFDQIFQEKNHDL